MNKRILVIDDFADIRNLFVRALEDTQYIVDTAATGTKGISLHKEHNYDLIFLDLNMPGMNGIEVLHKIRKKDKDVPVFIITALYKEFIEEIHEANQKGLKFEIANKPININQIVSISMKILEGSKAQQ